MCHIRPPQRRRFAACSPTASRALWSLFRQTLTRCAAGARRAASACLPKPPEVVPASRFANPPKRHARRANHAANKYLFLFLGCFFVYFVCFFINLFFVLFILFIVCFLFVSFVCGKLSKQWTLNYRCKLIINIKNRCVKRTPTCASRLAPSLSATTKFKSQNTLVKQDRFVNLNCELDIHFICKIFQNQKYLRSPVLLSFANKLNFLLIFFFLKKTNSAKSAMSKFLRW